jgi:hypothetical protein
LPGESRSFVLTGIITKYNFIYQSEGDFSVGFPESEGCVVSRHYYDHFFVFVHRGEGKAIRAFKKGGDAGAIEVNKAKLS